MTDSEALKPTTVSFFADLDPHKAKHFLKENNITTSNNQEGRDKFNVNSISTDMDSKLLFKIEKDHKKLVASTALNTNQLQDAVLWQDMGLCKALSRAVTHLSYIAPTPVQVAAIPEAIKGTDISIRAVTGSGKTAAFLLPLLNTLLTKPAKKQAMFSSKRKYIRALILVPTRELGVQCEVMGKRLLEFTSQLTIALAIGGVADSAQKAALDEAPDIVIATPGRLCDLVHNYKTKKGKTNINLSGVEVFVLDECDRLLTNIISDQMKDLLSRTEETVRQIILVSATMTKEVDDFIESTLFRPKKVDVGHVALAAQLKQQFVRIKTSIEDIEVEDRDDNREREGNQLSQIGGRQMRKRQRRQTTDKMGRDRGGDDETASDIGDDDEENAMRRRNGGKKNYGKDCEQGVGREETERNSTIQRNISKIKSRYLVALCQNTFKKSILIFTKYRTTAHRLTLLFNQLGISAAELQGSQTQEERLFALNSFTIGETRCLFCTDVASRGLDIKGVTTVINFDLPLNITTYIHRVGRTARIGVKGTAVSLVHETQDASIMRKILVLTSNINQHQVASVKRRDVPENQLDKAIKDLNEVFPQVRDILAAEVLEQKITTAEKRAFNNKERIGSLSTMLAAPAKRTWCLTKTEQRVRIEEDRRRFETEAATVGEEVKQELNDLDRQQGRYLDRQKKDRRQVREKKERAHEKELDVAKQQRKREKEKLKGGMVKQLKKQKLREARKTQRAEERQNKGLKPHKRTRKASATKPRHKGRMKRH